MGIDFYIASSDGDVGGCWRNIANEIEVLQQLAEDGCELFEMIDWPEDDEGEERNHAAEAVLKVVEQAIKLSEEMDDDEFNYGKEPFLEDLTEVKEAIQAAITAGTKVNLSIC